MAILRRRVPWQDSYDAIAQRSMRGLPQPVAMGERPLPRTFIRLVGALTLEHNDEWTVGRRYMSLESLIALSDNPVLKMPAVSA